VWSCSNAYFVRKLRYYYLYNIYNNNIVFDGHRCGSKGADVYSRCGYSLAFLLWKYVRKRGQTTLVRDDYIQPSRGRAGDGGQVCVCTLQTQSIMHTRETCVRVWANMYNIYIYIPAWMHVYARWRLTKGDVAKV